MVLPVSLYLGLIPDIIREQDVLLFIFSFVANLVQYFFVTYIFVRYTGSVEYGKNRENIGNYGIKELSRTENTGKLLGTTV